jgi:CHAT domain-containing protein
MIKDQRLLIVSDGALQYLPFAALPEPKASGRSNEAQSINNYRPLVAEHQIVSLPSASTLGVLRRELAGRELAPKAVAVLGDPVFSKDDNRVKEKMRGNVRFSPIKSNKIISESEFVRSVKDISRANIESGTEITRLPFTRREVDSIYELAGGSGRFRALDFDASLAAATNPDLGQYRIVHFATHGLLNSEHPDLSGLIFSLVDKGGNDRNGFLASHDVFNLKLPADLVVLSACETGLGKQVKGEGLLSLTRGFMYAGAARVGVSVWKVNDESTSELMKRFYTAMLGREKLNAAAALRAAQVSMWKSDKWRSPYYWAGFVIQGEPK